MPKWEPTEEWKGEDAYVVGGGPSLTHFDWALLRRRNTIGCNSAFILGADIVKINLFADYLWWQKIGKFEGASYGGRMVAAVRRLRGHPCPWLLTVDRVNHGLHTKALGYNGDAGSMALNLALLLGAKRVFLLGFDMQLGPEGQANFHTLRYEPAKPTVYHRFIEGYADVVKDLPIKFPGREVVNVTDGSALDCFPKVSVASHFGLAPYKKEGKTYVCAGDVGRADDSGAVPESPALAVDRGDAAGSPDAVVQGVAERADAE